MTKEINYGEEEKEETVERLAYSVPEVAKMLGISERKIWSEIDEGKLKKKEVGRRVLITAKQLDAYLAIA